MTLQTDIAARLTDVRGRVERAAQATGRSAAEIRLVAVAKTFPASHIAAAASAGQLDIGENRVQEALQKMGQTTDQIRWHLVGYLQSNKARKAAAAFHCIQSIDSVELLERVDEAAAAAGKRPELLVQVDLAGESTKHGAPPGRAREVLTAAERCRSARVVGLMLLPPFTDDPQQARPYFRQLRELRDRLLADGVDTGCLRELSMGMSHDFEIAIEEGSTMIRIGTAIFGSRHV